MKKSSSDSGRQQNIQFRAASRTARGSTPFRFVISANSCRGTQAVLPWARSFKEASITSMEFPACCRRSETRARNSSLCAANLEADSLNTAVPTSVICLTLRGVRSIRDATNLRNACRDVGLSCSRLSNLRTASEPGVSKRSVTIASMEEVSFTPPLRTIVCQCFA